MRRNATESVGALQSAHESILAAQPKTKIWLEHGGRFMIGDGGLHLLEGIARSGSLAEAVREIGWSYRHAWGYLRRAESVLGAPLLLTRPGKGAARGTTLTPAGRLLLERLRALRDRIDEALGPTGPTRDEIASRGRPHPRHRAKTTRRR
jgi:molybdate transport system regulatory protein